MSSQKIVNSFDNIYDLITDYLFKNFGFKKLLNFTTMTVINIMLYSIIIVSEVIGLFTTFSLFILMCIRRSVVKTDRVTYLLAANSYIVFIITSSLFIEMSVNSIYGELYPHSLFDGWLCRFKAYFLYINGCVYFFSFFLQSIFRFCRIVHPRRPTFQAFRLYAILSMTQWPLAAILLAPSYILGHIEYLPNDYHCQYPPKSVRKSLLGLSFLFLIPFILTLVCYFYAMFHIRTRTTALTLVNQNQRLRRDFLVLSRLFLLFMFLNAVALPHVLIPIAHELGAYIPNWIVSLEWALTVFSLAASCVLQICLTPHLQKLFLRPARIRPTVKLEPVIQH